MLYFCSINAKVAQLVEHNLAKVGVASSNLVFRSNKKSFHHLEAFFIFTFSDAPFLLPNP